MPNYAFRDTGCDDCCDVILQDEPIYFLGQSRARLCAECAEKQGLVCPRCSEQKSPKFALCYDCAAEEKRAPKKPTKARLI